MLPAPQSENFSNGSVSVLLLPYWKADNWIRTAIILIPSDGDDGMIRARFPAFEVEDGDHFTALTDAWRQLMTAT